MVYRPRHHPRLQDGRKAVVARDPLWMTLILGVFLLILSVFVSDEGGALVETPHELRHGRQRNSSGTISVTTSTSTATVLCAAAVILLVLASFAPGQGRASFYTKFNLGISAASLMMTHAGMRFAVWTGDASIDASSGLWAMLCAVRTCLTAIETFLVIKAATRPGDGPLCCFHQKQSEEDNEMVHDGESFREETCDSAESALTVRAAAQAVEAAVVTSVPVDLSNLRHALHVEDGGQEVGSVAATAA